MKKYVQWWKRLSVPRTGDRVFRDWGCRGLPGEGLTWLTGFPPAYPRKKACALLLTRGDKWAWYTKRRFWGSACRSRQEIGPLSCYCGHVCFHICKEVGVFISSDCRDKVLWATQCKKQKCVISQLWSSESEVRVLAGLFYSEGCEGSICPMPLRIALVICGQSLAFLGWYKYRSPDLRLRVYMAFCVCAHVYSCACICLNYPYPRGHWSYWLRTHPNDKIWNLNTCVKTDLQIRSLSLVLGVRTAMYLLWENTVQPITEVLLVNPQSYILGCCFSEEWWNFNQNTCQQLGCFYCQESRVSQVLRPFVRHV